MPNILTCFLAFDGKGLCIGFKVSISHKFWVFKNPNECLLYRCYLRKLLQTCFNEIKLFLFNLTPLQENPSKK